jgi:hypothetical protein
MSVQQPSASWYKMLWVGLLGTVVLGLGSVSFPEEKSSPPAGAQKTSAMPPAAPGPSTGRKPFPQGVCPPFPLRDEDGNLINPITGQNADKPYSPKKNLRGLPRLRQNHPGVSFHPRLGRRTHRNPKTAVSLGVDAGEFWRQLVFARSAVSESIPEAKHFAGHDGYDGL